MHWLEWNRGQWSSSCVGLAIWPWSSRYISGIQWSCLCGCVGPPSWSPNSNVRIRMPWWDIVCLPSADPRSKPAITLFLSHMSWHSPTAKVWLCLQYWCTWWQDRRCCIWPSTEPTCNCRGWMCQDMGPWSSRYQFYPLRPLLYHWHMPGFVKNIACVPARPSIARSVSFYDKGQHILICYLESHEVCVSSTSFKDWMMIMH